MVKEYAKDPFPLSAESFLREQNLGYKAYPGELRLDNCPYCEQGKTDKSTNPSFSIADSTGQYHCHKCEAKGNLWSLAKHLGVVEQYRKKKNYEPIPEITTPLNPRQIDYLNERGISHATIESYGVRNKNGSLCFPIYDGDRIVNYHYRTLDKNFSCDPGKPLLFQGKNTIKDTDYLIITEGEIDMLSWAELGQAGRVVSIPSGIKALNFLENEKDFLSKFKTLYINFDMDDIGQEYTEKALGIFSSIYTGEVKTIQLNHKDMNEALLSGIQKSDAEIILQNAKTREIKPLISFDQESKKYVFQKLSDIKVIEYDWLISQFIARKQLITLFAPQFAGKSFVAVDIGMSIATGTEYYGYRTEQTPVIYLAPEDVQGITNRAIGWATHRDMKIEEIPFYVCDTSPALGNIKDLTEMAKAVRESLTDDPGIVFVDTLAMALGDADPNKQMGQIVIGAKALQKAFNCSVCLIHHVGHAESAQGRERGGSELPAGSDVRILVEKSGEGMDAIITCTILKNKATGKNLRLPYFKFEPIHLGYNSYNERIETSVLVPTDEKPIKQRIALTKYEQIFLAYMEEPPERTGTGNLAHLARKGDNWLGWSIVMQEWTERKQPAKKIYTAIKGLEKKGFIEVERLGTAITRVKLSAYSTASTDEYSDTFEN